MSHNEQRAGEGGVNELQRAVCGGGGLITLMA